MQRIPATDPSKAFGKTKERLDAIQKKIGRVPNIHATMANSPAVLSAYLCLSEALSHSSLDEKLSELLAVAVASANDCEYCLSAHTATGKDLNIDQSALARAQEGASHDPKTRAALRFARKLVFNRGKVSDEDVAELRTVGFSNAAILEIVALTVMNIFTNYTNHVASTEVDFPRAAAAAPR